MSKVSNLKNQQHEVGAGTMKSYITGLGLSIVLTLVAYFVVTSQLLESWAIISIIVLLAVLQFAVQLIFFLHLGQESKPRWNVTAFVFMLVVLIILVFGSLWIMNNLNYHTMSPTDTTKFIQKDEGILR